MTISKVLAEAQSIPAYGQCVLKLSAGNLVLSPSKGNLLTINGRPCAIPGAGVSLAPTALTVSALYYIYAVATNGVVTSLEASATGHSTSATSGNIGIEIKTGDDTRSLVGMVRPIAGPAFSDSVTQRFVRSWFNDVGVSVQNAVSGATPSTSVTEYDSAHRAEFLLWAGEIADTSLNGACSNSSASANVFYSLGFNSTTPEGQVVLSEANANFNMTMTLRLLRSGLSEGYNYATALGSVSVAGTGSWNGFLAVKTR